MLGASSKFDILGSRPAGDRTNLKDYVRALGRAGFRVVVLEPTTKLPVDVRTAHQRKVDDAAAQEVAKAAGDLRWAEAKTSAGIQLATSHPDRLAAYVERVEKQYGEPPNLAVVPDRDMLIIDTDWAEGTERFRQAYIAATGEDISLTVSSPGVRNPDGSWKHGPGGGHFYLTLPEGYSLPDEARSFSTGTGESEWSIFPCDQYVLIPPSVRAEGPYRWVGEVREAPAALLEMIEKDAASVVQARADKAAKAAQRAVDGPSAIDAWASATDWKDLLEPDGWYFTGCRTACGCPEVTAPGVHASPKSATAHEVGCRETDTTSGHGPLKLWTDNPPEGIAAYTRQTGSTTMTKLQYVAWAHHGGDEGAACKALGIGGGGSGFATAEELLEAANLKTTTLPIQPAPAPAAGVSTPEQDLSDDDVDRTTAVDGSSPARADLPELFRRKKFNPYDTTLYPKGFHSDPELLRKIFDFSDETRAIFHAARSRRPKTAHPVAVLHRELTRRGMRAPVELRLWEVTPLSTFVIAFGRSGTGKSIAAMPDATPWAKVDASAWLSTKAANTRDDDSLDNSGQTSNSALAAVAGGVGAPTLIPFDFDATTSLGSGQALSDLLIRTVGKGDERYVEMLPHPVAWVDEDEVMTMLRAAKNEASTIITTLNNAWSGRPVGNRTRTNGDTRTTGPYSAFLWGGLQPQFADELLRHDDSGFLQRCVFTALTDPYRRLNEPSIPIPVPAPSGAMPTINPGDRFIADQAVLDEIDAANDDADFDHLENEDDERASHSVQVRIRLACLGALLHGTLHVSYDLWVWSGHVMEHSDRVFAWLCAEAALAESQAATTEGTKRSNILAAADANTATMVNETAALALAHITAAGADGITRGRIQNKLADGKKVWLNRALDHLAAQKLIYLDGTRFRQAITAAKAV